jgi:hypothetical protein
MKAIPFIPLLLCMFSAANLLAQDSGPQVSIAAMSIAGDSTGMVHWRSLNVSTQELQLSTRYFSDRLQLESRTLEIYEEAFDPTQVEGDAQAPMVSVTIPANMQMAFVILWYSENRELGSRWRANVFSGDDWVHGTLKILNVRSEPIHMLAGEKPIRIAAGGSANLSVRDFSRPFPVQIFRPSGERKRIFSSTWRVSSGRRELCFIAGEGDSVSFRSLIDLSSRAPSTP